MIAQREGYARFITAQNHYNLLDRRIELELVPAANAYGASILPYFPLASGMLTGKYKRNQNLPKDGRLALREEMARNILTEANYEIVEKIAGFADRCGRTVLDVAIGWLAHQKHVGSVIAGATRPEQVEQNVAAGNWDLTDEEAEEINLMTFRLF